ncbi:MAG: YihY family inner membrane protein [Gallionellaceae bacterium]
MKRNWMDLRRFLHFLSERFRQDRCEQMAASLTFTTLLSLVPLITIALMLFSAFPVFDDFSSSIRNFLLANVMPETGGKMISRYVEQFAESASRLTAVGIVFLGLTAMLMMHNIDTAFNTIWRVSKPRTLMQRIMVYWAVLTLGPLLVGGSLSLTSWLTGMSIGYAKQIPAVGVNMLKIVPILLSTLAFSLMFRVVPNRYVPLQHAVMGGLAASLMFEFMNQGFAYYIAHFPTYKLVYGAFASIPIFLLWIYLSWLAVLMGALISASLSHWRGSEVSHSDPAVQLYFAMRILRAMDEGMDRGTVQTLPLLSEKLLIGFDVLEQILEKLAQTNMVRKLTGNGWALVRNIANIPASELYRLFVFDSSVLAAQHEDAEINAWLKQMEQHITVNGDVSLQSIFSARGCTA